MTTDTDERGDAGGASTMAGPAVGWRVFARHAREPALRECGEVHAANEDDAVVFAHSLYDERRWDEMFVVPSAAVATIVEVP